MHFYEAIICFDKEKILSCEKPSKFETIAVVFPKQEPQDFRTIKRIPWNNSSETRQWRQQRFLLWSWTWASRGREQAKCCKSPWWKETHVKLSGGISVVVLRKYNSHLNNKTQGWKIVNVIVLIKKQDFRMFKGKCFVQNLYHASRPLSYSPSSPMYYPRYFQSRDEEKVFQLGQFSALSSLFQYRQSVSTWESVLTLHFLHP